MTLAEQPVPDTDQEIAAARREMASGEAASAVQRLRELIGTAEFNPLHHYWLAAARGAAGDWAGHHKTLKEAQAFHALRVIQAAGGDLQRFKRDAAYAVSVADAFRDLGLMTVASVGYGRGSMSDEAQLGVLLSYGLTLWRQGRLDEAVAAFAWAHQSCPGSPAQDFLLQALTDMEGAGRQHADEAGRWRRKFGAHQPSPASLSSDREGRRLRIGYFIPELNDQSMRSLAPVLDHHDPVGVSVTLYVQRHDPGRAVRADAVRVIGEMDDAAAEDLVRLDRIDVLVDLWGHGADGRLGVFVRKPAPVQVSWLNNLRTTGAPEIDYLIHADAMEVPGAQDSCVETIWRIGPVPHPYHPELRPAPSPTPATANGFVTFGYDGSPAGLNDRTLDAWSRILTKVPGSRLRLRHGDFADDILQNGVLMRLAARGVDIDQVRFAGAETAAGVAEIDVALDASPRSSFIAGCEAVANGVPFLTLAGDDYICRVGATVVVALGLDELAARSWDDYVDRAVELASDIGRLDALRAHIREAFDRSAWCDVDGFTRRLEAAFHDMLAMRQVGRLAATAA